MKISTFLTAVATVVTLVATVACNSRAVDDAEVTAKIKARLATDSQTSAIKIGVETSDGAVTLTGTVPTQQEKRRAEELATSEPGVKKVVNNINVDPNSIGATNAGQKIDEAKKDVTRAASDELILTKIKSKLLVAGLSGVDVDVSNGEVSLKGKVKNSDARTEAETLARNTDGVKSVKNELNVQSA